MPDYMLITDGKVNTKLIYKPMFQVYIDFTVNVSY